MRQIGLWSYSDSGALQGLVAPDGDIIPFGLSGTFAAMPDPTTVEPYTQYFVTDVGDYNGTRTFGSLWVTDGLTWIPVNGRVSLWNEANYWTTETASFGERLWKGVRLPAGLVRNGDVLEFQIALNKTDEANTYTTRLRMHTANSTGGTLLTSYPIATTNNSLGGTSFWKRTAATTVQMLGTGSGLQGMSPPSASGSVALAASTVPDMDSAVWVNITEEKDAAAVASADIRACRLVLHRG